MSRQDLLKGRRRGLRFFRRTPTQRAATHRETGHGSISLAR
ncbi:hypothetical protein Acaty_c1872 [Acidithiobacillus caldus ATCC 51756]|uniref:Uncharacterized protein n=1 Tax=Acidithiobacillus caldus (strain ATCC 51756 / DSM 8584 / KU) TaxID=637389 RepID=A0A060A0G4_ACICK|nr:hypothetical protein Acaty_c1872 [Acidithiobacillus caldus ATCC 51756]